MIILIAGASHSGKTVLAQKIMEKRHFPYLSIDHLKMGLIRAGYCQLRPDSDADELRDYLWPVVREIIKTAVENKQNLIVEGCYIPPDYQEDFTDDYLGRIRYVCLLLSEKYIENHYREIVKHASDIEARAESVLISKDSLLAENLGNLKLCQKYGLDYILIDDKYEISWGGFI